MKRFWHTWLAVVASTAMISTANAQEDWNQSNEIGSYQSILARAGYTNYTTAGNPATQGQMGEGDAAVNSGQVVSGQPMMQSAPMAGSCDGSCGGSCDGGCGGGYVDGGAYGGGCSDGGVYGRTSGLGNRLNGMGLGRSTASTGSNYVLSARALFMRRNHEDDVQLTRNGAGDFLGSNDNRMGTMGGIDVGLTKRNANGNGFEARYWGLYPGSQLTSIAGPGLDTYQTGLNTLFINGGATNLQDYYNNSATNQIYRSNIFHNVETNFLRNGANYTTRHGRSGNFELLGGARWFQFNEDFTYSALYPSTTPAQVNYNLCTENTLLGAQLGARNQVCLTDRLSLASAIKFGLFNNHISQCQDIQTDAGVYAYRTSSGVDDYVYQSTQNSLSTLSELDMGINYRVSQCTRLTAGYRVLGITGLALAPSQIPANYNWEPEILDINANDSMILGGGYAGLEVCY